MLASNNVLAAQTTLHIFHAFAQVKVNKLLLLKSLRQILPDLFIPFQSIHIRIGQQKRHNHSAQHCRYKVGLEILLIRFVLFTVPENERVYQDNDDPHYNQHST
jgi:hypothetical protein